MITVHTAAELRAQIAQWRAQGQRIAFVPTMGNLHQGHLALMAHARSLGERVVASVFVNPLQFGPNEDFGRYPRTLDADRAQLEAVGVDLLFAPVVEEVYVNGFPPATTITVSPLSAELEGAFRPGFFTGVATVVSILFNLVQPDLAIFGDKDWQQLQIIRRMVADLRMPIEIVGHPTTRAGDGLALSSRNQYLSAEQRALAPALHAALCGVAEGLRGGRRDHAALIAEAIAALQAQGFATQYLEIRAPDLGPANVDGDDWVVLVAAVLGTTRLIDNVRVVRRP